MFARRAGRRSPAGRRGGRFDGVLGVLAGLEILRTPADARYMTEAPLEIVNWTDAEGTRFAQAMLASGADAAWCAPPLAGFETTLAIVGAYVFAGELVRVNRLPTAEKL